MKKTSIALLAAAVALGGCSSHPSKPAANPAVATEVEQEFMQRWVDQRTHDYLSQGKFASEAEARTQAAADFSRQFPDTLIAQKSAAAK